MRRLINNKTNEGEREVLEKKLYYPPCGPFFKQTRHSAKVQESPTRQWGGGRTTKKVMGMGIGFYTLLY